MTPQKQLLRHDPANGVYGDCHRAAVASLLDLPIEEVPHFCDESIYEADAESLSDRERKWLLPRGLVNINVLFPGETSLEDVLTTVDLVNPGVLFILGGTSVNHCGHSVVAGRGKVVHDPGMGEGASTNRFGSIIGPMKDGYWWLTFIGAAVAYEAAP